ncbi:MAG TPA: hypothetical protein VKD22_13390, partial [Ramlibacter sp.]|nr:hypothetical protein [Ramlibacter sp.]
MRIAPALLIAVMLTAGAPAAVQPAGEPPNAAAALAASAGRISLVYEGRPIVAGTVSGDPGVTAAQRTVTTELNGAITQVVKWTATGRGRLSLDLTVTSSPDAIAVEVDRGAGTLPVVRTSIGPSHNLRNRAV